MYYHYNRNLKLKARELRNNPTRAERIIWYEILRNRSLSGYRFLRQRPIANYIVDFFCKELCLIIEIDGMTHEDPTVKEKDVEREDELLSLGFSIIRFTDFEVLNGLDKVEKELKEVIKELERKP